MRVSYHRVSELQPDLETLQPRSLVKPKASKPMRNSGHTNDSELLSSKPLIGQIARLRVGLFALAYRCRTLGSLQSVV